MSGMLTVLALDCHWADDRVKVYVLIALVDVALELAGEELHRHVLIDALLRRLRLIEVLEGHLEARCFH